jgi:hypothetical protein
VIALSFANAGMLAALIALPAIWYFLRLTPPKPRLEEFPPTRLLVGIARKDEQPARSPWWLTALRLTIAAMIILALAGPVHNPAGEEAPGEGPLLVVIDNSWAAANNWNTRVAVAQRLMDIASDTNRPVGILATADGASQSVVPTDPGALRERIEALAPRPWQADYDGLVPVVRQIGESRAYGGAVWLTGGLGGDALAKFGEALEDAVSGPVTAYLDGQTDVLALKPPHSGADALKVEVIRAGGTGDTTGLVRARDIKGRIIGEIPFAIEAGQTIGDSAFELPVELRNEIVRLEIAGVETAGAVQLIDDRWRRRRVGLLSGGSSETAQPLLSPLFYISRAVQPFADIHQPREANADLAVPALIEAGASVIAMADIGTLSAEAQKAMTAWVRRGGTLVRFAGPRMAAGSDALIPVTLRGGKRILGGSMSWQTPQPLASFSDTGPFSGLAISQDIRVNRQVLADPDGALAERTWAALADGTPLVTAVALGDGWLVLFHVTADPSWSNLPLSGTFVEMLRRIVTFSANIDARTKAAGDAPLAPYRLVDGFGRYSTAAGQAQPVVGDIANLRASAEHPPGLYGTETGFRALNLMTTGSSLVPFDRDLVGGVITRAYPAQSPTRLAPWLLALALLLLMIDTLVVLWLSGRLHRVPWRRAGAMPTAILIAVPIVFSMGDAWADEVSDQFALAAVNETHLAYMLTGDSEIDATSRAGLDGLTRVLASRTALEPGAPIGIDPEHDELSFFPLLYWPVSAQTPLPTAAAMARLDAYMRRGGSVLFDTRDQLERSTSINVLGGTPAVEQLRKILASLDIPPLEPVPVDHVLTKAFYLLNDFPGRYAGGPLWVEAHGDDGSARAGDGVSTIMITSNDFAAAWAIDSGGSFLFPTVPPDRIQREMSFRVGINIVMYTLTGNYKADQVHIPALLERLGQ